MKSRSQSRLASSKCSHCDVNLQNSGQCKCTVVHLLVFKNFHLHQIFIWITDWPAQNGHILMSTCRTQVIASALLFTFLVFINCNFHRIFLNSSFPVWSLRWRQRQLLLSVIAAPCHCTVYCTHFTRTRFNSKFLVISKFDPEPFDIHI